MNYLESDLGFCQQGDVVTVTLTGDAVNVQLLDPTNLAHYKNGNSYHYHGGHVTRSPFRIAIPHTGHWHVVIDGGGYDVRTRASVTVQHRNALP